MSRFLYLLKYLLEISVDYSLNSLVHIKKKHLKKKHMSRTISKTLWRQAQSFANENPLSINSALVKFENLFSSP